MRDGIHVFLLGPRRYGKSSIVERALAAFRAGGGRSGYADLIRCTTEAEVAEELLGAVVNGVLHGTFDPVIASRSWQKIFDDAVDILDEASSSGPVAVAVDEFQRVADVGSRGMGGAFKAAADRLHRASLVLAGSHLTVMEKLTKARGAPLHGMGELFVVDVVPEEAMVPYLQRRARTGAKRLSKASGAYLYSQAGGVPNDVQWLAYAAFEEAGDRPAIDEACVDAGMRSVVARQAPSFAERFEALAPSQQRVLKLLAARPTARVYAKEFLSGAGVANANAVKKAIDVLSAVELVHRRGGMYEVASPFLRGWLLG